MDVLSYDDATAYDDLPAPPPMPLANRIGGTKIYLFDEALKAGVLNDGTRKRKMRDEDDDIQFDPEEEFAAAIDSTEASHRPNAILLTGSPISRLTTAELFAYAISHATDEVQAPMGLEWIDDTTCILVFPTNASARGAFETLRDHEKSAGDGLVAAFDIPEAENAESVEMGTDGRAKLRMRWATMADVKQRGAKKASEFYRKHGMDAGKFPSSDSDDRRKRRRRDGEDEEMERARLDEEMDRFLAAGEDNEDGSTRETQGQDEDGEAFRHSTMRADFVDPRSLLSRTSVIRVQDSFNEDNTEIETLPKEPSPGPLNRGMRSDNAEEISFSASGLPLINFGTGAHAEVKGEGFRSGRMRADEETTVPRRNKHMQWGHDRSSTPRERGERGGRTKGKRTDTRTRQKPSKKTQEELDAELDDFLGKN